MGNNKELMKVCVICGDRATGYNFNAVCCESCKAFFRRNASKYDNFKCHFEGNCKIDLVSRKFCKKCRLKKCFDVGMKKEWILNDEQKQLRRTKIEENRKKRKNSDSDSEKSNDTKDNNNNNNSPISDTDHSTIIVDFLDLSPSSASTTPKRFNGDFDGSIEIMCKNLLNYRNRPSDNIHESVYQKTAEFEMSVIPIARPIDELTEKFNDLEINRLVELLNATHKLKSPEVPITSEAMTIEDGCKVWRFKVEQEIHKMIKMSKVLESFQKMCENDQIALMKYGCIEIFCMRLTMNYNFEREQWTYVTDDSSSTIMKLDLLRSAKYELYRAYKRFLDKIRPEWESDTIILDLLTAIILFNPDRPNLMYREMVKLQQHIYMYLLQRYLYMRYPTKFESKTKFLKLMSTLIDLHVIKEIHVTNCLRNDRDQISPLLREVCDVDDNINNNINQLWN
ncbi:nuclear hormone receptor HR96-like [Oppia nitens]|uniref:nuclear hormone receptor HR96-like n=1 Tax=Oppia nitens TaxID=1686743 RepID=UPI0023DAFBE7|nr:nuclear hormone receptor HR96-like [Oppia nitens]